MEQKRQYLAFKKRREQRKRKLLELKKVTDKAQEREAANQAKETQGAMKRSLKKMFAQRVGTLMIDEELQNDELMIKLRKWKQAKKKLEAEKLDAEIQEAQPDM